MEAERKRLWNTHVHSFHQERQVLWKQQGTEHQLLSMFHLKEGMFFDFIRVAWTAAQSLLGIFHQETLDQVSGYSTHFLGIWRLAL